MSQTRALFYGGKWHMGNGILLVSENPSTGSALWEGNGANADDARRAVDAAYAAFPAWAALGFDARLAFVEAFRERVEAGKATLSHLIAKETGKPLWDAEGEVAAVIGKIAISVQAYHERTGSKVAAGDITQSLSHHPLGVMVVLGPYNFPAHLPNGHIVPALLAGNTVVFKPSEYTPRVAEWLVSCWEEVGLPSGVVNMVQGGGDVGAALLECQQIAGVLFTGSYNTGRKLHAALGGRPEVMLALEMGGNNPLVAWDVDDVMAAATMIVQSAFMSSGQRCTCARRLIVSESQRDALVEALLARMDTIRVGDPFESPAPFMGPVISERVAKELLNIQDIYRAAGAKMLRPMERVKAGLPYLSAGLVDVSRKRNMPDDEFFGPFLQMRAVATFEEALAEANNTAYGLAAGLLSKDKTLWERFRREIRAGVVNWNRPTTGASSALPFGGVGHSGNLRPSAYYAADYCAYPMASLSSEKLAVPQTIAGLDLLP